MDALHTKALSLLLLYFHPRGVWGSEGISCSPRPCLLLVYLKGWEGIILYPEIPDRLFTRPGLEGIIPGYPHKSPPR
jgi:hypothetical protein